MFFFITGGSRVHFPRASPVPLCDVCNTQSKLQALVYDILSPTSAIMVTLLVGTGCACVAYFER